jgi:hypothetical protein
VRLKVRKSAKGCTQKWMTGALYYIHLQIPFVVKMQVTGKHKQTKRIVPACKIQIKKERKRRMRNGTDFVQANETNDARLQVNNRKLDTRPGA